MNTITLINQSSIPSSWNGISLFVNKTCVMQSNELNQYPVFELADSLSVALNETVHDISISPEELAMYLAEKNGKLDEFQNQVAQGKDLEHWITGYTQNDLIEWCAKYLEDQKA